MREIAISIFEKLDMKFKHHSKVNKTELGYSFEKEGNTYSVFKEEYVSNGIAFYVEKNGVLVTDKMELREIYDLAKKIFVPTDPELKKAMSEMSKIALSKALERQYPPKPKNDEDI